MPDFFLSGHCPRRGSFLSPFWRFWHFESRGFAAGPFFVLLKDVLSVWPPLPFSVSPRLSAGRGEPYRVSAPPTVILG